MTIISSKHLNFLDSVSTEEETLFMIGPILLRSAFPGLKLYEAQEIFEFWLEDRNYST